MTIANAAERGVSDCVYTVEITLTCKGRAGPESVSARVSAGKLDEAIAAAKARLAAGDESGGVSTQGSGGGGSR